MIKFTAETTMILNIHEMKLSIIICHYYQADKLYANLEEMQIWSLDVMQHTGVVPMHYRHG